MVLLAACSSANQNPLSNSTSPADQNQTTPNTPGQNSISQNINNKSAVKEFTMTANNYQFSPSTITVNKGDTVRLKITSLDKTHGIAISEYGINEVLPPNKEVTVEFVADKSGSFTYFCSVPCGPGHADMKGTLVVNP